METGKCTAYPEKSPVVVRGGRGYLLTKRLFDIIASSVAGMVLLIPMLVIGILIRLESEGPVFYSQERLGKDGRPFVIYKFRSMVPDAEANGPRWAAEEDPRCTRLGHYLRLSRLDELPQLYNILIGDMSFVGPRPERACFYEEFERYIPDFRRRLEVRPGLTGYAQVYGGFHLGPEEKLRYDLEYMENRSFLLDICCILRTIPTVVLGEALG